MKYPAGLYQGERTHLALYNFNSDVHVKLPEGVKATKVAHVVYEFGNRQGGIDIFELSSESDYQSLTKIVTSVNKDGRTIYLKKNTWRDQRSRSFEVGELAEGLEKYNVHGEVLAGITQEQRSELEEMALADIIDFCGDKLAKNPGEVGLYGVDLIVPVTKLKVINPVRVLTPGKQDFVPSCVLQANIDFGQGCVTGWIPGEGANFDGENFIGYESSRWDECQYCYAMEKHKTFPKTIYAFDQDRLEEELDGGFILNLSTGETLGKKVKVLRFGKRTESYTPFTEEQFKKTLESCVRKKTRPVIPTKLLPFSTEIAGLLERSRATVLFSIGYDFLEKGAVAYGCDNETRVQRAIEYRKHGVNSVLYLTLANPAKLNERDIGIISLAEENNLPIQFLPVRYKRKDVFRAMTGLEWGQVKGDQRDLFNSFAGDFIFEDKQLIPKVSSMDSRLLGLIGKNKGDFTMCHHDDEQTFCGGCGIGKGSIGPRQQVEKRTYAKNRRPAVKELNLTDSLEEESPVKNDSQLELGIKLQ